MTRLRRARAPTAKLPGGAPPWRIPPPTLPTQAARANETQLKRAVKVAGPTRPCRAGLPRRCPTIAAPVGGSAGPILRLFAARAQSVTQAVHARGANPPIRPLNGPKENFDHDALLPPFRH